MLLATASERTKMTTIATARKTATPTEMVAYLQYKLYSSLLAWSLLLPLRDVSFYLLLAFSFLLKT